MLACWRISDERLYLARQVRRRDLERLRNREIFSLRATVLPTFAVNVTKHRIS